MSYLSRACFLELAQREVATLLPSEGSLVRISLAESAHLNEFRELLLHARDAGILDDTAVARSHDFLANCAAYLISAHGRSWILLFDATRAQFRAADIEKLLSRRPNDLDNSGSSEVSGGPYYAYSTDLAPPLRAFSKKYKKPEYTIHVPRAEKATFRSGLPVPFDLLARERSHFVLDLSPSLRKSDAVEEPPPHYRCATVSLSLEDAATLARLNDLVADLASARSAVQGVYANCYAPWRDSWPYAIHSEDVVDLFRSWAYVEPFERMAAAIRDVPILRTSMESPGHTIQPAFVRADIAAFLDSVRTALSSPGDLDACLAAMARINKASHSIQARHPSDSHWQAARRDDYQNCRHADDATTWRRVAHKSVASARGSLRLVSHSASVFGLDWAPDGQRLALSSRARGETERLRVLDRAGQELIDLGEGSYPSWSHSGHHVAFVTNKGVVIASLVDGGRRLLTSTVGMPKWSPDDRLLALQGKDHALMLVEVASGALMRHHTTGNLCDWYPDGLHLLVGSTAYDLLAKVDLIAGKELVILRGLDGDTIDAARFVQGELGMVLLGRSRRGSGSSDAALYRVSPASGESARLASLDSGTSITDLAVAPDGTAVAFVDFDRRVYVADL